MTSWHNLSHYRVEKLDDYEKSILREFTLSASAAASAENQRNKKTNTKNSSTLVGNKRTRDSIG